MVVVTREASHFLSYHRGAREEKNITANAHQPVLVREVLVSYRAQYR